MLKRIIKGLDFIILSLLLILMIISIFCIYSATLTEPDFSQSYIKMMYFYGLGFMVLFIMLFFNYKLLLRYSPIYYFIGVGLLVLLFFKGDTLNNAQGWFILPGGIGFQPAELCKLILILFLSYFLSKREVETHR
ncbi:FtsW/RodA/SpoVE family cell cycle protein, partial [Paenibacillus sp. 2RAB27]|uniref:FtsW/RodA/SpoVE family cell cycle protein n=1 Tax=Paenibacillus sp. 2RAB27 TaxID=3232991 RepID=UPI003F9CADCC